MKKILLFILLVAGLASCREVIIYRVINERPILFSQQVEVLSRGNSQSRGTSLENLNGMDFGVRAYLYETLWESEESTSSPHRDWLNTRVKCSPDGMCSYEPVQNWSDTLRYTFFGYYPYRGATVKDDPSEGTVTLSDEKALASPTLTYTLSDEAVGNTDNGWVGNCSKMIDVMYGSVIDAEKLITSSVDFHFHHCLSGIELVAENFNEYPVVIEDFALQLKMEYRTITVPMNGDPVTKQAFPMAAGDSIPWVKYQFVTSDQPLTVNKTLNKPPVDINPTDHILLIPQKGIMGKAIVKLGGATQPDTMSLNFPDVSMLPGTRYVIDVQFVEADVNVLVIEGTDWIDKDSEIEFE